VVPSAGGVHDLAQLVFSHSALMESLLHRGEKRIE
jgi:hypothetical protein